MSELSDYGSNGLVGVLTPQANTTVEPEIWALLQPGWSLINARLTSQKGTIAERLVDYTTQFADTSDRFANAPVDVIAAACTGASYLIGLDQELRLTDEIEARRNVPFLTAALASTAMLRAMDARKIALLTPYPESLNRPCIPYWEGHGFTIVAHQGPALREQTFHPIYSMAGDAVLASYRELSRHGADAILMLGTGMATLRPLLAGREEGLTPAISCNLALSWAASQKKSWRDLQDGNLSAWLDTSAWADRAAAVFGWG
ncbi:MAG: hypothetical protein AAGC96_19690 [Pseudomonadota bacterium]